MIGTDDTLDDGDRFDLVENGRTADLSPIQAIACLTQPVNKKNHNVRRGKSRELDSPLIDLIIRGGQGIEDEMHRNGHSGAPVRPYVVPVRPFVVSVRHGVRLTRNLTGTA